ncbi:hypothetical protein HDV05_006579, partial [Chytridiales sp. JEL 0842]
MSSSSYPMDVLTVDIVRDFIQSLTRDDQQFSFYPEQHFGQRFIIRGAAITVHVAVTALEPGVGDQDAQQVDWNRLAE